MLHEHQQATLLQLVASGEATQEEAAHLFGVSRWYVRKLIMQSKLRDVNPDALSPEDQALLEVARATGLNADQLKQALALPPLTDRNIFLWLTEQKPERLARILFQATMTQQAHQQGAKHAATQTG